MADEATEQPERAALALAEAATRLSDKSDPVPDEIWNEAAHHYDEKALGALIIQIGLIPLWHDHLCQAGRVSGEYLLLQPANRQHSALQGHFTSHPNRAFHRSSGQ